MIKLFVSDIDGTLLTNVDEYENGISDRNLDALTELQRNNVRILLATGRHHNFLPSYPKHRDFWMDTVANNGAYVYFNHEIIYKNLFTKTKIRSLLNDFPEIKHKIVLSDMNTRKVFYSPADADIFFRGQGGFSKSFGEVIPVGIEEYLESSAWVPPSQIFCHFNDPEETHLYESLLNERYQGKIRAVSTVSKVIDLMCSPGCKSFGIQMVAEKMGIKADEIAVVGDSFNDVDMLCAYDLSFCMSNAKEEIKKYAKSVVGGVEDAAKIVLNMNSMDRIKKKEIVKNEIRVISN